MIRNATASDSEPIARALWNIWHQFKAHQIASPLRRYACIENLAGEIQDQLDCWFVFNASESQLSGFFALSSLTGDPSYKRWGFPGNSVRIDHFACLLAGEIISEHLQVLALHLPQQSILLCIPASLREAHWAALKAGFRQLGECPLVVGAYIWLFLDRDGRHEEIQKRLRRAKIVI